jgi:hypothetical protein
MEIEKPSGTKKRKKSNKRAQQKDKGKQSVGTSRKLRTHPTNKFRLNAKAIFDPSLKNDNPIIIDDDTLEGIPIDIGKKENVIKTLKDIPMKKTRAINSKRQRVISKIGIPKQDDEAQ